MKHGMTAVEKSKSWTYRLQLLQLPSWAARGMEEADANEASRSPCMKVDLLAGADIMIDFFTQIKGQRKE